MMYVFPLSLFQGYLNNDKDNIAGCICIGRFTWYSWLCVLNDIINLDCKQRNAGTQKRQELIEGCMNDACVCIIHV